MTGEIGALAPEKTTELAPEADANSGGFVVGIDVEQGPGLAALRGLVAELAAVADRLDVEHGKFQG